jgi:hypothetical protein
MHRAVVLCLDCQDTGEVVPEQPEPQMFALVEVLTNLRDSLVQVFTDLKDHIADFPSTERDEVLVQVERYLARVNEGERGSFE